MVDEPLFEVRTPIGVTVRTTAAYWERIVSFKHPIMRERRSLVLAALENPKQVRRSRRDPEVHLYYAPDPPYHVCVVVKCEGDEGFVVTAYRTDRIKEGEPLWPNR